MDSRPSFETRDRTAQVRCRKNALLRMRTEPAGWLDLRLSPGRVRQTRTDRDGTNSGQERNDHSTKLTLRVSISRQQPEGDSPYPDLLSKRPRIVDENLNAHNRRSDRVEGRR